MQDVAGEEVEKIIKQEAALNVLEYRQKGTASSWP